MRLNVLKLEADKILHELELLDLLNGYGEARAVGSYALDLIVKRDVDVHLLVQTPDLLSVVDAIYHQLLEHEHVHEVRISDHRARGGVKIGIDSYPGKSGDWSIDIWVTDRLETTGFTLVDRMQGELTPERREAILRIKGDYYRNGQLRPGLSLLIYRAVIDKDVRSVEDFHRFLSNRGRQDLA